MSTCPSPPLVLRSQHHAPLELPGEEENRQSAGVSPASSMLHTSERLMNPSLLDCHNSARDTKKAMRRPYRSLSKNDFGKVILLRVSPKIEANVV